MRTKSAFSAFMALVAAVVVQLFVAQAAHADRVNVRVICQSERDQYTNCYTGLVHVYQVRLINQYSRAACIPNRTFGVSGNYIWVDRGCRGDFAVDGIDDYRRPPPRPDPYPPRPYPPQPPPPQPGPLPQGSYLQSCGSCSVDYNYTLQCQCRAIGGAMVWTVLNLNYCAQPPVVHNNNGNLVCGT